MCMDMDEVGRVVLIGTGISGNIRFSGRFPSRDVLQIPGVRTAYPCKIDRVDVLYSRLPRF